MIYARVRYVEGYMRVSVTSFWNIVPATWFRPGKLIEVTDSPGRLIVMLAEGHFTERLRDQMNDWHDRIFGTGVLVQEYGDHSDRTGRPLTARFQRVPADALPARRLCWPILAESECVWLVSETEMSEELRVQFNELLDQHLSDGHWILGAGDDSRASLV
jgi:hypothetical protein